ncbi:MAG: M48 family metallopeptidase [Lacibacter sp.]|jgi:predicted Zn-dependent protease
MKKVIFQLLVIIALFLSTWLLLSRIDFVGMFRLKQRIEVNEKKLGDFIWRTYVQQEALIQDTALTEPVQTIFRKLCSANKLDTANLDLYVVHNTEVNAFAFPGNRLVVYTGLISACSNAEELAGVLAHELAHVQKQHVMKKLSKEIGIGILAILTSKGGNSEIMRQIIRTISSAAYDRSLEAEADETAVDYLCTAGIDTAPLAHFFLRLSQKNASPGAFYWMSTHPELKERAAAVLKKQQTARCKLQLLMPDLQWNKLQHALGNSRSGK